MNLSVVAPAKVLAYETFYSAAMGMDVAYSIKHYDEVFMARVSIPDLNRMRAEKKKIVVMTAYDFSMAQLIDRAEVDMILVGDSGGRNLLGHEDYNSVTMDEMVLMTRSVSRGSKHALVIGDMPFMSYQVNKEEAIRNAGRLIQEGEAQAVKLEVGAEYAPTVEAIVKAGIPVMAHMGLTPQTSMGSDCVNPNQAV